MKVFDDVRVSKELLSAYIDDYSKSTVLIIADLVLDEYITGGVERHSREAPILVLNHESTLRIPGGGANTAMNLARLGAKVKLIGLIGDDPQGEALLSMLASAGVDINGVFKIPGTSTVTKTRILGHTKQAISQQIVRLDRKNSIALTEDVERNVVELINTCVENVDVVICSDYSGPLFTPKIIASALKHERCLVDTQVGLERYKNAMLFTPNLAEAECSVGFNITSEDTLQLAGERLLEITNAGCIIVTRGCDGMSIFERGTSRTDIPSFNTSEVRDVTGAGDTTIAAIGLSTCSGANFFNASILGSIAAGLVIRQEYAATVTASELQVELQRLSKNITSLNSFDGAKRSIRVDSIENNESIMGNEGVNYDVSLI